MFRPPVRSLLPLLVTLLGVPSCADARGRFESFEARAHSSPGRDAAKASDGELANDATYDGGPCQPPAPNAISGAALLALAINGNLDLPILFAGMIDTPERAGTTAVHFVYRALDAEDRSTRVGDALEVGPLPLADGVLEAKVPESTLDGRANPIARGVPLTSALTLHGHICGAQPFYCGSFDGQLSGLISGPLTGQFGITLLSGPDAIPARPRFGCGTSDLAPELL